MPLYSPPSQAVLTMSPYAHPSRHPRCGSHFTLAVWPSLRIKLTLSALLPHCAPHKVPSIL